MFNKCGKCAIITSHCFLTRSWVSKVNTLTQVLIENKKCRKNIIVILVLSLKQAYIGLGSLDQVLDRWIIRKLYECVRLTK